MSVGARWVVTVLLLALATGFAVGGCFGVWAKRQALETDPWVNTSEKVLKNQEVRDELGRTLSDRVFRIPAVRDRLASLPADDARTLRRTVRQKAPQVLGSKPALRAWRTANRRAHILFLKFLDGNRDTVTLNVRALLVELANEAGLPKSLVDNVPRNITSLQIVPKGKLQGARQGADAVRTLAWVLPLIALVLFAAAIAVAPDRRRALAATGGCLVLAALTVLLLRRIGRGIVVNQLAGGSEAKPAVQATWSIATSLLVTVAIVALVVGVLLFLVTIAVSLIRTPPDEDASSLRTQPLRR
jgi:hypothetical protein